jgi:hypothetical protein
MNPETQRVLPPCPGDPGAAQAPGRPDKWKPWQQELVSTTPLI